MSTRSVIQIVGNTKNSDFDPDVYSGAVRIYRHCDGYPSANLPTIAKAVLHMESLVEQSFKWRTEQRRCMAIESMAQAVVAFAMDANGLIARVEEEYSAAPRLSQLGDQGDLEWFYVVDCNKRLVNTYTVKQCEVAGQTQYSATPKEHLEAGMFTEIERVCRQEYKPEAADAIIKEIADAIQTIEKSGWLFNVAPDPYLKIVQRAQSRKLAAVRKELQSHVIPALANQESANDSDLKLAFCI